jgi:GNAT superfamily N-acetyltransferase
VIRAAGPADRDAVVGLLRKQLDEHDIALEGDALTGAVEGALATGHVRASILLCEEEGRAVGVAYISYVWTLEHGGHSAWLEELYVEPALREQGLGSALLEAAIATARDAGCAALDLEVEASHARVESLYARRGFRPHSRRRFVLPLR